MIHLLKTAALGATVGDALLLTVAAMQSAPVTAGDLGAGGLAGAATSVAVLWAWKGITDERIKRIEDTKADKEDVRQQSDLLKEVREDVKWLIKHKRGNGDDRP